MVERLKIAIAKAREQRASGSQGTKPAGGSRGEPLAAPPAIDGALRAAAWDALPMLDIDESRLVGERVVTIHKNDPAHVGFDMLRTRLTRIALDQGYKCIGITSPSKGCGKTVVTANLAFSFARNADTYSLIADFDLRSPRLSRVFGLRARRDIRGLIEGRDPIEAHLERIGPQSAVLLNNTRVRNASELLQNPRTRAIMDAIIADYGPEIMLFDLPPLLLGDEALGFLPRLDGALLVAASGQTRPGEIETCETLITEYTNFLGVVLNKVDPGEDSEYYYYSYGYGYGYGSDFPGGDRD